MYLEVMKLLRVLSMPVAESHLRLRLESHPDYPSLVAVQDTLKELGIESYACQGTKDELEKENKPFLAHFNDGDGDVRFFKDLATAERQVQGFDRRWSGNVMFADPAKQYGNTEHNDLYKKERSNNLFGITALVLFTATILSLSVAAGTIPVVLLIFSNAAGLYFSWLITQKEFGVSNSISDKICNMAKHSRCESVLFSKGAKLFNLLSWGDVGMVFFTGSLFYLLLARVATLPINLYYLLSLAGLGFPLYSLYYQWKVVKQWCMLCIGVLAVLCMNAITSLTQLTGISLQNIDISKDEIVLLAAVMLFILCAWQFLKSIYQKSLASLTNEIRSTRLKRDPEIFNALLEKQGISASNLPAPDEAIRFGDPAAPHQLVIACNPYCSPCAKAHEAIEYLFEKYPGQFSVAVRFVLQKNDPGDNRVAAVKEIVKVARSGSVDSVKDWYHLLDLEKFKTLHAVNEENVDATIDKYILWSKSEDIHFTPTIFLNGRKLPKLYSWVDFVETMKYNMGN
ncbi:MAG TPA: vitamin K epoxide reductase family protein [Chitinophagaceae bacterium]|jgi:uncharacterized membrane protein|nr:vitamin K epoxide reductase family protein [Chitinophagaceae bacterium]